MRSMTGFASIEGDGWRWEARSVNSRGLELRLRLPPGWERHEREFRAIFAQPFARGTVSVSLSCDNGREQGALSVNRAVLDQVISAASLTQGRLRKAGLTPAPICVEGILALRGVLETESDPASPAPSMQKAQEVGAGAQAAAGALAAARAAEGAKLAEILSGQVDEIERLAGLALDRGKERSAEASAKLRERIDAILAAAGTDHSIDQNRIAQELAVLVVKQDVQEEIDRLHAHVTTARSLMASGEPVGRKLDFLTQEFNREANTLCSKAQDPVLSEIGIALKVVIDQMREQAANVE
ncbi:MAG: YicC family protein [Neomegalonema sp.]|nr:YicC family protein [Neomegalonema sp.]